MHSREYLHGCSRSCQFSVLTFDHLTRHVNDEYRSNAMNSLELSD